MRYLTMTIDIDGPAPSPDGSASNDLTAEEAARILGYHLHHVYRLLRLGIMQGQKTPERTWQVSRAEVLRIKRQQGITGRRLPDYR